MMYRGGYTSNSDVQAPHDHDDLLVLDILKFVCPGVEKEVAEELIIHQVVAPPRDQARTHRLGVLGMVRREKGF